jgi:hypothetical protein
MEDEMYRILTEDKNRPLIIVILGRYLNGYTITQACGVWMGEPEKSLAIDVVDVSEELVLRIAKEIKEENEQESVLVIHFPSKSTFV